MSSDETSIRMSEVLAREYIYNAIKDLPESEARTMAILSLGFLQGRLSSFRAQLDQRAARDVPREDELW